MSPFYIVFSNSTDQIGGWPVNCGISITALYHKAMDLTLLRINTFHF